MSAPRENRIVQAGAIPYRWHDGRLEIAMITRRERRSWIVPKGHIEAGETPRQSALREAGEEAGLLGKIARRPCGSYEYRKGREPRLVLVFLLQVTRELVSWSEDHVREREWLAIERAIERVRERGLRHLLRRMASRLSA